MTAPATIPELIAARAASAPKAIALLAPGRAPLSYGSLAREIEKSAVALGAFGVARGDRVALAVPPGPEAATAFLAAASGASAAPLNPQYTAAEFTFYLTALRPRTLIAGDGTPEARRAAAKLGIPVLGIRPKSAAGAFDLESSAGHAASEIAPAKPEDIALLLHTSGTTARPKLVPLTHANLLASAAAVATSLALSPADRGLCVMPLFHIHGLVAGLLAPLLAGGSVAIPPGFHAIDFFSWLRKFRPAWYTAVPSMHQAILAHAARHRTEIATAKLRFIRSSSAALAPPVLAELEKAFCCPVIESYGMTEAAHQMASNPLPPRPRKPGTVGPMAGPDIRILGERGNFRAPGETGEVVIRGPNVTAGYLDNPEANRNAFHDAWFRTGDLGFFDPDGYLTLVARIKEIINRGGEKVAPREIEEAMLAHSAVGEAAAFPVPDPALGEEVGCAVVLKPGAAAEPRELREFASRRLAYFKLPRYLVFVDAIPKGATGKIQRAALAKLLDVRAAAGDAADATAPRNELERALCALWCEVLQRERVGIHGPFLDLGGDSILAAQLVARIRDRLSVPLTLADIWDTPTVAAMAARISERQGGLAKPAAVPRRKGAPKPSFPQEWWLSLEDAVPGTAASNRPSSLLIEGKLDAAALARAFSALVRRQEALRMSFPRSRGERKVRIEKNPQIALPIRDLSRLRTKKAQVRAEARARLFARVPFDSGVFPLWRAELQRLSSSRHVLAFVVHHAIFDGWSMAVFARDLAELYQGEISGKPAALPGISISYSDLAAFERRQLSDVRLRALKKFWTKRLAGAEPPRLPFARKRPARPSLKGGAVADVIPPKLAGKLRALGRGAGATLYMTALAVFQAWVARRSGTTDIITGCLIAGRDRLESGNLIGLFFNALPLRGDLSGDPTPRELIGRTRDTALSAFAHADMPIARLVESRRVTPKRDQNPIPLVPILAQMRNLPPVAAEGGGVRFSEFAVENEHARFDLTFDLAEAKDGLRLHLAYNADIFDAKSARKILDEFVALSTAFVTSPDSRLSTLVPAGGRRR